MVPGLSGHAVVVTHSSQLARPTQINNQSFRWGHQAITFSKVDSINVLLTYCTFSLCDGLREM